MSLDLFHAKENDLKRAFELTERTNQLNSTGKTYSFVGAGCIIGAGVTLLENTMDDEVYISPKALKYPFAGEGLI